MIRYQSVYEVITVHSEAIKGWLKVCSQVIQHSFKILRLIQSDHFFHLENRLLNLYVFVLITRYSECD